MNKPPASHDSTNRTSNVFIGATIVNQAEAERDIPKLIGVPSAKRFLSMEPLLGPVDLTGVWRHWNDLTCEPGELPRVMIDWVIVGGESDKGARPMHPAWARSLRDQCAAAGVLFMFKQWGEWVSQAASGLDVNACYDRGDLGGWVDLDGTYTAGENAAPKDSDSAHMFRMGKHQTGRMLDGMLHDAVPA